MRRWVEAFNNLEAGTWTQEQAEAFITSGETVPPPPAPPPPPPPPDPVITGPTIPPGISVQFGGDIVAFFNQNFSLNWPGFISTSTIGGLASLAQQAGVLFLWQPVIDLLLSIQAGDITPEQGSQAITDYFSGVANGTIVPEPPGGDDDVDDGDEGEPIPVPEPGVIGPLPPLPPGADVASVIDRLTSLLARDPGTWTSSDAQWFFGRGFVELGTLILQVAVGEVDHAEAVLALQTFLSTLQVEDDAPGLDDFDVESARAAIQNRYRALGISPSGAQSILGPQGTAG